MSGIRWFRVDDMDQYATSDVPVDRSERLREIVDQLPPRERHLIERLYFGGAPMCLVAKELGISEKRGREIRADAFERIRDLLEGDEMGPLLSAAVGEVG